MNPLAKLFVPIAAIWIMTSNVSLAGLAFLGPTNDADYWYYGQYGTATVSFDSSDSAYNGGHDFLISNTVAGPENKADWRSQPFSLGPAAGGARPVTFTFAYKLPDTVAKRDNIHVQLRFFDSTGTRFISEKVIPVGARTGDSEMTGYKTITMPGIIAPRKARTADVWINAGSFDPWTSGNAQFANISVTTAAHSWLFLAAISVAIFLGVGILVTAPIYLSRKRSAG